MTVFGSGMDGSRRSDTNRHLQVALDGKLRCLMYLRGGIGQERVGTDGGVAFTRRLRSSRHGFRRSLCPGGRGRSPIFRGSWNAVHCRNCTTLRRVGVRCVRSTLPVRLGCKSLGYVNSSREYRCRANNFLPEFNLVQAVGIHDVLFPVKELLDELRLVDWAVTFVENNSFRWDGVRIRASVTFTSTPVVREELWANSRVISRSLRVENVNVGSVAIEPRAVQVVRTNPEVFKRHPNIDTLEICTVRFVRWRR